MLGLVGVVTTELLIDDAMLFDEGSQVELLEAHLVDWPPLMPATLGN